jgi:hypothetical protein
MGIDTRDTCEIDQDLTFSTAAIIERALTQAWRLGVWDAGTRDI